MIKSYGTKVHIKSRPAKRSEGGAGAERERSRGGSGAHFNTWTGRILTLGRGQKFNLV